MCCYLVFLVKHSCTTIFIAAHLCFSIVPSPGARSIMYPSSEQGVDGLIPGSTVLLYGIDAESHASLTANHDIDHGYMEKQSNSAINRLFGLANQKFACLNRGKNLMYKRTV